MTGTKQVMVILAISSTAGSAYGALPNVNQPLNVTDADIAGLASIPPTALPNILERDGSATVIVRLLVAAESGVTLSFTSQFTSVATLSSTPLFATLTTTSDRATVTLGAIEDSSASGNRDYALLVTASGPGNYAGLTLSLAGIVLDDDTPNLLLDPTSPPAVTEGSATQVTVKLATQPASNVNVAVSSSNPNELLVSPAQLIFTDGNWNTNQIVTLSGVSDNLIDGLKQVTVTYDLSSSDPGYATVSDVTQSLGVIDSDVAGLVGIPETLPNLNENGGTATGTATLTVGLLSAANAGVTLVFTNPTPAVATLSSTSLRVMLTTTADKATVTLAAIDDSSTGDRLYSLKVTVEDGPFGYSGLERTVTGTVFDDDMPGVVLDPPSLPDLPENSTSQVNVDLSTQPTSDVTVAVSSSDTSVLTVPSAPLVFTADNWSAAQRVELTIKSDGLVAGPQTVTVTYSASSADTDYSNLPARTQTQVVTDVQVAGLVLDPRAMALPPLSEPDGMATVTLRLIDPPTSPVTLAVWSSDTSVATLTSATVTLELMSKADFGPVELGVVDDLLNGDRSYELRVSVLNTDGGYDGVTLSRPGMVIDDDAVGVRFVPAALPDIAEGESLTVSVALGATPTALVTLEVSSNNTLASLSRAMVSITLSPSRLSAPVTISGVNNTELANQTYTLTVSAMSSDTDYDGQAASATGRVISDDLALVANLSELGIIDRLDGSVTVELRLGVNPAAAVAVKVGNINPNGANLLGPSGPFQSQTFPLTTVTDILTITLTAVSDTGAYPRSFGLQVTVTPSNPADAGFNFTLALIGTVREPGATEDTVMLYISVADLAAAGLAIDLVSDYINGGAAVGPRAQIGGRSVTGLSAADGVSPPQSPDPWSDSNPWSETDDAAWKDGMALFSDSGFVLPLSSGARVGAGTELWGGVRYSDVSGEPAIAGVRHSYDGDAAAVHVGVTRRFSSGVSAGFSVGHTWVDLEVKDTGDNEVLKARRRLLSVHPYVSVAPFPNSRLLLLAGYGEGTYSTERSGSVKASTRMAAGRLEQDWQLSGIDLSGKLGVLSVESEVEEDPEALRGRSLQSRVELEFSKSFTPDPGMSVRPYGSLGYLHESGTIDDEGGVEVGAGLQGSWDAGLDADISARYQLDGAKRIEHKLKGRLSFDWGKDRRGLLLDASQEHSLSEEEDGRAGVASEYAVRLGHGWGRTLWRRHGVLGAYMSTVEGSGGDFHGPRLGLSFEAASLELVAEHGLNEGRVHLNYVSNF